MKSSLRQVERDGVSHQALMFVCPGCMAANFGSGLHMLAVNTDKYSPSWTWDGNLDAPTLSPSILTRGANDLVCHSFLRNGVFEFLSDSTHPLSGQFVPIPDLPDWVEEMVSRS